MTLLSDSGSKCSSNFLCLLLELLLLTLLFRLTDHLFTLIFLSFHLWLIVHTLLSPLLLLFDLLSSDLRDFRSIHNDDIEEGCLLVFDGLMDKWRLSCLYFIFHVLFNLHNIGRDVDLIAVLGDLLRLHLRLMMYSFVIYNLDIRNGYLFWHIHPIRIFVNLILWLIDFYRTNASLL